MAELSAKRILVVDDSEANRLLLNFILEELGFEVDEVNNGEKAVEWALEHQYVAIFMDINMPIMSGTEAVEILRRINYQIPIFACSAEDDPSKIRQYMKSGFSAYVTKPIEPDDVRRVIRQYLNDENSELKIDDSLHQKKLDELGNRFISNIPVMLHKIQSSLESDSFDDLKRIAHKLKGTASQFGFELLSHIGKDIESAINKNKIAVAKEKAIFLIQELKKLERK